MKSFFEWAGSLRFRQLFFLTLLLFIADLIVPDFIPIIDELILGLMTLLLGSIRKKSEGRTKGKSVDHKE